MRGQAPRASGRSFFLKRGVDTTFCSSISEQQRYRTTEELTPQKQGTMSTTEVTMEEPAVKTTWQEDLDTSEAVDKALELFDQLVQHHINKSFVSSFKEHPGFNLKTVIALRGNRDACKGAADDSTLLRQLKAAMLQLGMSVSQVTYCSQHSDRNVA
jgi:hypothetical protein